MKNFFLIFLMLFLVTPCTQAYNFKYSGRNLYYNPDELKFYENSKPLNQKELAEIFPDREIILISKFDKNKKYVIKNSLFRSKKILLLNDTKRTFHLFDIYPETSRYEIEEIKSLVTIWGKKNARLKHQGGDEFEIVVK